LNTTNTHVRWANLTISVVRDDANHPLYYICVIEDITARKQAEEQLKRSEERLRFALDSANMVAWDYDLTSLQVTRQGDLKGVLVLPPAAATADHTELLSMVHPDDREGFIDAARSALVSGSDYRAEYRIVRPDGQVRWLEDRGRVVRNAEGVAIQLTGVRRDITEQRLAQEEIARLNERLHRAVYESSHRIKNHSTTTAVLPVSGEVASSE
jgi:PAS domain-containing protein